jgi:S-adenosylmethionine uptake transporter
VLWGFLVWREFPDTRVWIGILIIVAAGLYVLYRERATGTPTLWRHAGWRKLRRRREGA